MFTVRGATWHAPLPPLPPYRGPALVTAHAKPGSAAPCAHPASPLAPAHSVPAPPHGLLCARSQGSHGRTRQQRGSPRVIAAAIHKNAHTVSKVRFADKRYASLLLVRTCWRRPHPREGMDVVCAAQDRDIVAAVFCGSRRAGAVWHPICTVPWPCAVQTLVRLQDPCEQISCSPNFELAKRLLRRLA